MKGAGDFDWFIQALNKDLLFIKPSHHPNVFPTMASFSIWFYKIGWKLLQWCKLLIHNCLKNIPLLFLQASTPKLDMYFFIGSFLVQFSVCNGRKKPPFQVTAARTTLFPPVKMLTSAIITFLRIGDLFFQNLVKITFPTIIKHFQH